MAKFLSLAAGVTIGVTIFLGVQWYLYVTGTANPHDEFGTELNAMMPEGLNEWGCTRLKARFPEATAPEGCKRADGDWR